jgi:hypothetical protein
MRRVVAPSRPDGERKRGQQQQQHTDTAHHNTALHSAALTSQQETDGHFPTLTVDSAPRPATALTVSAFDTTGTTRSHSPPYSMAAHAPLTALTLQLERLAGQPSRDECEGRHRLILRHHLHTGQHASSRRREYAGRGGDCSRAVLWCCWWLTCPAPLMVRKVNWFSASYSTTYPPTWSLTSQGCHSCFTL